MPNWTNNVMTFNSIEDAEKVWKGMMVNEKVPKFDQDRNIIGEETIEKFSYQSIIPLPKSPEGLDPKYIKNEDSYVSEDYEKPWLNWYEWNYDNWGVKWDACEPFHDENDIHIYFDSPWGKPVDELFEGISKKFNVTFCTSHDYEDEGWEEIDYWWSPDGTWEEVSQWQIEENEERRREYEDDELED